MPLTPADRIGTRDAQTTPAHTGANRTRLPAHTTPPANKTSDLNATSDAERQ